MATNLITAVQEQYATLSATRPAYLYWEYLPVVDPVGTAVNLPIVMFYDAGNEDNITFETITTETYKYQFRAFNTTYDSSRSIYNAIMFNGVDPALKDGFAYSESFVMPTGYQFEACIPLGDVTTKRVVNQRTGEAINCYQTTWTIAIQVQRNA